MFFIQPAYAQDAGAAAPEGQFLSLGFIILMFAVMWFFMIRPQQKKAKEHRNMIAALKVGDEIMTGSGLLGKIVTLNTQFAEVEISKGVQVKLNRQFIAQVLPKGTLKNAAIEVTVDTEEDKKEENK